MFERFTQDARHIVRAAESEAHALGATSVEAEHLLLALAADERSPVGALLAGSGLSHDELVAALEREVERSLAAVGVAASDFATADLPSAPRRRLRFGASAKRALERAVRGAAARGDGQLVAAHLLLGLLRAEMGTVPRALAVAEVDRIALATRVEGLLDRGGGRSASA